MKGFQSIEDYRQATTTYELLPFRFIPLNEDKYVLTNIAGEYLVTSGDTLTQLLKHELPLESVEYRDLRARHFLADDDSRSGPLLLSLKLRTRYDRLRHFTGLHMFVVTLRCEHACPYCQVSRQSEDRLRFDMSQATAAASVDLALLTPSPHIKIEFQGGEPLLNFPLIEFIVHDAKTKNRNLGKDLAFVIATNLALLTDEVLDFCIQHDIMISTSLDGPKALHNANRPRPGGDSYERTIAGIGRARHALGHDHVSALMTTTEASLTQVRDIIDQYVTMDFPGICLRPLSPYGFAVKTRSYQSYNTERWLAFYKDGLE